MSPIVISPRQILSPSRGFGEPPTPYVRVDHGVPPAAAAASTPEFPSFPPVRPVRRRRGADWENILSGIATISLLIMALFVGRWFIIESVRPYVRPSQGGTLVKTTFRLEASPEDPPPRVARGSGAEKKPDSSGHSTVAQAEAPSAGRRKRGDIEAAERLCGEAIERAQKGMFDEADFRATKALSAAPGYERAEAIRLLVAYQRQYVDLAEEALLKLNGNNIVKLGPKYGDGAFVERKGDAIVFRIAGGNKPIPIAELKGTPGVQFRIVSDYLGNAENPANDMILGAYHYVSGLTDEGTKNASRAFQQAQKRWRRAADSRDKDAKMQAEMLMRLPLIEQEN